MEKTKTQILSPPGSSMIEWNKQTPNEMILSTDVDRPALLVISQVFHKDWVAFIDQEKSQIYRCDGVLTCVMVNQGKHVFHLRYQPTYTYLGMVISLFALLAAVWYSINKPDRI
jgi:uncharacterized membrane protein YfhO